ncbi:MAG: hypothetical protein EHM46_05575, partial [Bacteroidetes bacterium]
WSEPIKLEFNGIDPSIFFDEDGRAYVVHNDAPDPGTALYEGHRVIKVWEYDVANDRVIPGTGRVIVNGGVDLSKNPIWIEAPHIYKKNGKYYLMCAEGGTGGWHSEVIFSSDHPMGPYQPAPGNPILTQRYFARDRANKVDWAGHADLVEGPGGKYYGVFLGIRPNEKDRVNIGRETFILPVDWSGEFPVFENGLIPMEPRLKMPSGVVNRTAKQGFFPNGNFTYTEDFTSEKLDYRWIGLRGPREAFIEITRRGLLVKPFEASIRELKPTSTLFYRQQHNSFSFEASMSYRPGSEQDLAGIVCLQNETSNYVFGITRSGPEYILLLEKNYSTDRRRQEVISEIIASAKIDIEKPVILRVEANGDAYEFSYSAGGADFTNLGGTVSGDILSTNVAGGFTGTLLGLYATSSSGTTLAQSPRDIVVEDFKPSTINQPGREYPTVNSQGRVRVRIEAPDAHQVQLDIGAVKYDLVKDDKGFWTGESAPQDEGFHYYQVNIDGASVPDPGSLFFYGAGRWGSGVEVPATDQDFYALREVPHGNVSEHHYYSKTTGSMRRCFVYTP